jgi:hypothetical protein
MGGVMNGTSDYLDVPENFKLEIPVTFRNRIEGVCLDQWHCTIANAVCTIGARLGILALGRRGISRTMVSLILDPAVWSWAKPGQEYRARLTDHSATVAVELDDWWNREAEHRRHKAVLRKMAKKTPDGLDTVWDTIIIVAPAPSQKKGYRAGYSGNPGHGPRPPVGGAPARRYNGAPVPVN